MYGQQTQGALGKGYDVAPEARQLEVRGAIDRVAGNAEYLATRLQVLAERIQPVLTAPAPANQVGTASPCYSCELASRIGSHADMLSTLGFAVDDLLSRLEI